MFKDIHCHLLPGIDDGSKNIEETIKILKKAEADGVTEIVFTPHYICNSKYSCNNKDKSELMQQLVKAIKDENINIKVYLGNEVYINDNFLDLMMKREIMTINNSRYLLLEFPLNQIYQNSKEILYQLVTIGCVPILAHPERYSVFQKKPELVEEYVRMGILMQGNYKSLFGKYGRNAKKTLEILLKKGLISFLGSDTHHYDEYLIDKARKKVKKIVKSEEVVENLFCNNFDKVVNDQDFSISR